MVRPPRDRAEATFHPISEAFFRLQVQRRRSGYIQRPLHTNVPEKRGAPNKALVRAGDRRVPSGMAESLVSDQEEEALLATVPGQGAATVYRTETALPGSYASVADVLRVNMPEDAKEDFAIETIEQWLRIAKNDVDTYLGQRFELPLKSWSEMVVWAQGELAVCGMLGQRDRKSTRLNSSH